MSDIFTEVDEEVRREQLKKLWERYGNYVIAAVILVIAAVAAWRGYDYWQIRKAAETGAAYDAAARLAEEGKHGEAALLCGEALAHAEPGPAGWLLPVDPLLHATDHRKEWSQALATLRDRAV